MLEVCLRLNVKCVSAYAFSIENFKRPKDEVSALMKLAEEKLVELSENGYVTLTSSGTTHLNLSSSDLLDEYGVRLNVIGKTELLPESVQKAVRKAEDMTRHNDRYVS